MSKDLAGKLADYAKETGHTVKDNSYVFINRLGGSYTSSTINKRFNKLKELIYEQTGYDIREVTLHYFRHTYATRGLQNGIDLTSMKELLGHASSKTLLEIYSHSNDELKRSAVNIIKNSLQINSLSL